MTVTEVTTFARIHFFYTRSNDEVLSVRRQRRATMETANLWRTICSATRRGETAFGVSVFGSGNYLLFEQPRDGRTVGFLTEAFDPSEFDVWFLLTMLANVTAAGKAKRVPSEAEACAAAEAITALFEQTIKNTGVLDLWAQGRGGFLASVEFYTRRGLPVEFVLPAFPCKLSNLAKVSGVEPDCGEAMALQRIVDFVRAIEAIYAPGGHFYVVSDGHVFSDCINVDDHVVDEYGAKLERLYEELKPPGFDGLRFRSLNHCFQSQSKHRIASSLSDLSHVLETRLDAETEENRKILMKGCDDGSDKLRRDIKTPNHPRLSLYRGFNKFMSDDLQQSAAAQGLKKGFKKRVAVISFEMIRRNDAYSNLVELVFPFHVRLSIHAHNNAGPKYGIRLLDPNVCTVMCNNEEEENRLLHIPTPWHNAIFNFEGKGKLVVAPASLAKAFEEKGYQGGWDAEHRYFAYRNVQE